MSRRGGLLIAVLVVFAMIAITAGNLLFTSEAAKEASFYLVKFLESPGSWEVILASILILGGFIAIGVLAVFIFWLVYKEENDLRQLQQDQETSD